MVEMFLQVFGIVPGLGALAVSVWTWMQSPAKKAAADTEQLALRVTEAEGRIKALNTTVEQLPDKEAFHQLDKALIELRGTVQGMANDVVKQSRSLERIENFLIDAAAKR